MNKKLLKAFTLTEVVVVLTIIAVVVSASLKITKTKMDSVISYTYYMAYETLRKNATEMIRGFNSDMEIYTSFNPLTMEPDFGSCNIDSKGPLFKPNESECIQPSTVPRNGINFCLKFAERSNILGSFPEGNLCNGDAIDVDTPTFVNKAPDMVLGNGIRIFNMANGNLSEIDKLTAVSDDVNIPGTEFKKVAGGTLYNVDTYGYTVYVDIDGATNGSNSINDDIYPFYITLSGKVIPDWNLIDGGTGGINRIYLQVSLSKLSKNNEGVFYPSKWILKSVSFQEAACKGGIVNSETKYCLDIENNKIEVDTECSGESKCELYTITPIKGFGIL